MGRRMCVAPSCEYYTTRQTDISGKTFHDGVTSAEGYSTVSWLAKYCPALDSNSCPPDQDAARCIRSTKELASWYRFSGSRQASLQLQYIPLDGSVKIPGILDCLL
jgi:hypothetical protein